MELTREEELALEGEEGEAAALAMKVLVNLGDLEGAGRMLPIGSAHVSGVSYLTAGGALLKLLEEFTRKGAKAKVPSSLNPAGMDLACWERMGIGPFFASKQSRIIELFSQMGIDTTCSCIPYELSGTVHPIRLGEHVAWGESNAVIYANSVVGARTNREGGISSLASAITGLTPEYGLHLDGGRLPTFEVEVRGNLSHLHFDLLGAYIGKNWNSVIAHLSGIKGRPDIIDLKHLGASLAAKGGHAMFHMEGVTPEHRMMERSRKEGIVRERLVIGPSELEAAQEDLYPAPQKEPDIYVLGCPQFGPAEFGRLHGAIKGRKLKEGKRIIVFTSKAVRSMLGSGVLNDIVGAGVEIYDDTCMVVTPLRDMGIGLVGTDSGKAAHYIPKMSKVETELLPMELMVERSMG
ncbi:MAG: aconitase X catalytic domain-containing protein [Candidatus Thermoplasmatota archaeon]|jgi:hypothetical protein|nr:aconitase X catalytic domain-containing protein [Candidatus Thermoplasmatota archaeon]